MSRLAALVLFTLTAGTLAAPAPAPEREGSLPGWLVVDYSELVDRRHPSHSSESVGV